MDYEKISQETVTNLYRTYHSLKKSPLNATIRSLLELRISQINGCEYCCEVHTQDAKKAQVTTGPTLSYSNPPIKEPNATLNPITTPENSPCAVAPSPSGAISST